MKNVDNNDGNDDEENHEILPLMKEEEFLRDVASSLCLEELLQQLNGRNIRYPPTATRFELEQLLSSNIAATSSSLSSPTLRLDHTNGRNDDDTVQSASISDSIGSKDIQPSASTSETFASISKLPLLELIELLNQHEIRYPPTATRAQLGELLWRHQSTFAAQQPGEEPPQPESVVDAVPADHNRMDPHVPSSASPARKSTAATTSSSSSSSVPNSQQPASVDEPHVILDDDDEPDKDRAMQVPRVDSDTPGQRNKRQQLDERDIRAVMTEKPMPDSSSSLSSNADATQRATISQRSLSQLLEELDIHGIRYSPAATRLDLEDLWRRHQLKQTDGSQVDKSRPSITDEGKSSPSTSSRTAKTRVSPQLSLSQLLEKLDEHGIRYPPTASRADLEALWWRANQRTSEEFEDRDNPSSSAARRVAKRQQRDETTETSRTNRSIPKANVESTEAVVEEEHDDDLEWDALEERQRRRQRRRRRQEKSKPPLRKILSKTTTTTLSASKGLSRQVARFGQKAVRQFSTVAEKLLSLDDDHDEEEKRSSSPKDNGIRDADYYYVTKYDKENDEPIDVNAEPFENEPRHPKTTTTTPTASRRQNPSAAGSAQRRYQPFDRVGRNGVDDDGNDGDSFDRRVPRNDGGDGTTRRRRNSDRNDGGDRTTRRRRNSDAFEPPSESSTPFRRTNDQRPATSSMPQRTRPLFQLPAASNDITDQNEDEAFRTRPGDRDDRRRRRRSRSDGAGPSNQRIYSPYGSVQEGDFNGRDAFDRFGDFVAKAAEDVLWGPGDDEENRRPGSYDDTADDRKRQPSSAPRRKPQAQGRAADAAKRTAAGTSTKSNPRSAAGASKAKKRHWKDRLAESFDYLLGLHDDGTYYNSWQKQVDRDREDEGGYDAMSVAQGRAPKRKKKSQYDKPIWEEEGNLISLLFGRTQSGNSLLFERVLDRNSGSLLNLISAAGRSFLIVASYLFRWASVRGALPQSVVVVCVVSAGICARAKNRLRNMIFTLLLLRTLGEVIHGYVYGEDWAEEEDESELYEEDDEPE